MRAVRRLPNVESHFPVLFLLVGLVAYCVLVCGCGTYSQQYLSKLEAESRLLEPAHFSDEASRDIIRQTQKLMELKDRDYLAGPDDVLEISIFEWEMREQTKTLEFRISGSGVIVLPALGAVHVAGKTLQEIQKLIVDQLAARNILQNPRVAVSVKEYRSRRIAVIGAVNSPGVYALHENVSTLLDVLTLAGGPADNAGEVAFILRKKVGSMEPVKIAVDLGELISRGRFDLNAVLQGGDIVYVPKAPLVYVYGNVRQPGGFALQRATQVLEVLALAGGFTTRADKRNCLLIRKTSSGPITLPLDITRIERGKAPNLYLREGDVLNVPESAAKTVLAEIWDVFRGVFTFTYRLDNAK